MSKFVPNGWENQRLDELSKVVDSAHQTPIFSNFGIPMVRVGDINGGKVSLANTKLVTDDIYRIFAKNHEPKFNDVLMTRVGSYGRSSIVKTSKKFCLGQNTVVISPRKMNSDFLYQFLQTENINNQIEDTVGGSSQKSLSLGAIKSLRVLTPPFPEQQKIAKILTSVDEVIEKTQAQIDKLKDLKTGMMQELLTHGIGHTEFKDSPVGKIPAEWEVKTVESVLSKIIDYRGKAPPKSEIGVPLITAKNIRNGFINQEPREYIYEDQFDSWMVRGMPLSGDVFITTEAPLGNVAKVPNYKFAIGQRVLTLRPNEFVCTEFLLFILQSEKFKKELDLQSTGSTVAGIKQSTFRKVLLPVPAIDEQIKISESLNSIVRRSDVIKDKLQTFKSLKKALMQDLLTGKVRVKVS